MRIFIFSRQVQGDDPAERYQQTVTVFADTLNTAQKLRDDEFAQIRAFSGESGAEPYTASLAWHTSEIELNEPKIITSLITI